MRSNRIILFAYLVVGHLLIAWLIGIAGIRFRAQNLIEEVKSLKPGTTLQAEVESLARRNAFAHDSTICESSRCRYAFTVSNAIVSVPRLVPYASLSVFLYVSGGRLNEVYIRLHRDTGAFPTSLSGVYMNDGIEHPAELEVAPGLQIGQSVGKPYLKLRLDSTASQRDRALAYSFSFKCLTQVRDCDLPCDYHPRAWERWSDEVEGKGFRLSAYYNNVERCEDTH